MQETVHALETIPVNTNWKSYAVIPPSQMAAWNTVTTMQ